LDKSILVNASTQQPLPTDRAEYDKLVTQQKRKTTDNIVSEKVAGFPPSIHHFVLSEVISAVPVDEWHAMRRRDSPGQWSVIGRSGQLDQRPRPF
jgi:hypothetical protein